MPGMREECLNCLLTDQRPTRGRAAFPTHVHHDEEREGQ